MNGYTQCTVVGNLTRRPEMRQTPSGKAVTQFSVACNDSRGGCTFVDVTAWDRQAEVCNEYLDKGSPVMVVGRLHAEKWKTKEGQERSKLTVVASTVLFLGQKPAKEDDGIDQRPAVEHGSESQVPAGKASGDDSLPF